MEKPLFELVTTKTGAISIRNNVVGEIMHNPVGPWVEANALYVDQSRLRERLSLATIEPLVVFDVGLGAAANALAALVCARETDGRGLSLVSFERDLALLRFALESSSHFAHFKGYEEGLTQLLQTGEWSSGKHSWKLHHGDFSVCLDAHLASHGEKPHVIFYDPYSPKVNREMWSTAIFSKIRGACREPAEGGTSLYTYSQATRIRVSLLRAGFHVGYGAPTGLKTETTVASTDFGQLASPLGASWLERWSRSHDRYPYDCEKASEAAMDEFIKAQIFA